MTDQSQSWSRVAAVYEREFIDPYREDVRNPLLTALEALAEPKGKTAADLGCGIGPLLPALAARFRQVHAVDFADGMLERARERCRGLDNVTFLQRSLTSLEPLAGQVHVATAVNSLVMPDPADIEASLRQIRAALVPGGQLLAIVPAMDAVHYYTMLLLDRARERGQPPASARQNAAALCEHPLYDFAFGQFRYQGIEQHFWQPFEVRYRLRRAGFRCLRLVRVALSWAQFAAGKELQGHDPPWDWFFQATPAAAR
jgi:SAM-dependent methyltransferase